jgi:asparagine synthase (glutamine-hydrolysing)
MCGINGIVIPADSNRLVNRTTVEKMRDIITHRGPDESGIFVDQRVGLGHRRLSIVDLATGQQPMTNEDGSLHIIFNGEIYNHTEYRAELQAKGHIYKTNCDTETILHLYEEHGTKCVDYLRGMFAFAIWDQNRRELFIARDRLGVKPLYYYLSQDGSLYFASEIKSILVNEEIKPELNYSALPDYLANHAPSGEETLFSGIKRLMPGHTLRWSNGKVEISRYWDIKFSPVEREEGWSDRQYIDEWFNMFRTAVRIRLMADVPLGMFLSGGIDSSAIAAVMSGMVREPIKTFSVAFAEREANELEYSRLVARAYKTDHHEVVVSPEEFFKALPGLVWHEDEPLAHPSSVALYFVSKLASHHVKVVLTGEGSDELLAGYERYRKTVVNLGLGKTYHRFSTEGIRALIRRMVKLSPVSPVLQQKLSRTFLYLKPEIETIYFDNFAVFSRHMQQHLLSEGTRAKIDDGDPYAAIKRFMHDTDASTLLNRLLYADMKTYLHELLMKQDQMSMAASIESRVPFLDHKLVEFTARMPERMKLRGMTTKFILRESMKNLLPQPILTRPKMGFPVPIGSWFRGPFRHIIDEYILSDRTRARDLFNAEYVNLIVNEHMSGRANHSERLWALVNFEIWYRQFIEKEQVTPNFRQITSSSVVHV